MKKLLLSFIYVALSINASADSFSLVFRETQRTSDDSRSKDGLLDSKDVLTSGLDYVSDETNVRSLYDAKSEMGKRLGTNSSVGFCDFTLVKPVVINAVEVNLQISSLGRELLVNDVASPDMDGVAVGTWTTCRYEFSDPEPQTRLKIATVANKSRVYVKSVTVYYGEGGSVDPVAPADCIATLDGNQISDGGTYEITERGTLSVGSDGAEYLLMTIDGGEETRIDNPADIELVEDGIYTFQGVNGDLRSEISTYSFEVDDLQWKVAVGSGVVNTDASFIFSDIASLNADKEIQTPDYNSTTELNDVTFSNNGITIHAGLSKKNKWPVLKANGRVPYLLIYSGSQLEVSAPDDSEILQIVMARIEGSVLDEAYSGDTSLEDDDTHLVWTVREGVKVNNVKLTIFEDFSMKDCVVIAKCGETEYAVAAPLWYLNDQLLDCAGSVSRAPKVKIGDQIKAISHKRTHLYYYLEDANTRTHQALKNYDEESPWKTSDNVDKNVYVYTIKELPSNSLTFHAKALHPKNESIPGQETQLVLSDTATSQTVIEMDDEYTVPEYFNLHGQRIPRPTSGIYLKKVGSTVVKMVGGQFD